MNRPGILLLGAGGHARACIDVVEQAGTFAIVGLAGLPEEVGLEVLGYRVLGSDSDLPALLQRHRHAVVAAGQIRSARLRIQMYESIVAGGGELPVVVSPFAYVSPHATLGEGTMVLHGAVVNAGAEVGRNCIINSQSLVEHDAIIGDHCHLSTGAVVNGGATVGSGTFIGSGSVVREGLSIGQRCIIGMGQRVLRDCADDAALTGTGKVR